MHSGRIGRMPRAAVQARRGETSAEAGDGASQRAARLGEVRRATATAPGRAVSAPTGDNGRMHEDADLARDRTQTPDQAARAADAAAAADGATQEQGSDPRLQEDAGAPGDTLSPEGTPQKADAPPQADALPQAEAVAARRSNYELPNKKNTSLRNMLWALAVTMIVVAVVAIGFFGVGTEVNREVPENSRLDVSESAQRARDLAPFPVAEPSLDDQWVPQSAQYAGSEPVSWTVRYTTPQGQLVTMEEQAEVSAPMLSAALPGARVDGETALQGAQCQELSTDSDGESARGISCAGEDWGLVVHGNASMDEQRALMEAAVSSL